MTKTKHPNIIENKVAKEFSRVEVPSSPWLEDYLDCFQFKMLPVTEAFIERISSEMVLWAKDNPEALKISQFYSHKGISRPTFEKWCQKYPVMKSAKEQAMLFIGDRRETGAVTNKLNSKIVMHTMHFYDDDWRNMDKHHVDLKIEDERAPHTFNITIAKPKVVDASELKGEVDETI